MAGFTTPLNQKLAPNLTWPSTNRLLQYLLLCRLRVQAANQHGSKCWDVWRLNRTKAPILERAGTELIDRTALHLLYSLSVLALLAGSCYWAAAALPKPHPARPPAPWVNPGLKRLQLAVLIISLMPPLLLLLPMSWRLCCCWCCCRHCRVFRESHYYCNPCRRHCCQLATSLYGARRPLRGVCSSRCSASSG
jgi:hypothetical protein